MSELPTAHFLAILLTFLLARIVKGVTGMGLPTIAMGVLGTLMPPVTAASVLIVPSFVTNVWQLVAGRSFTALIARLWTMMLAVVVGTIAASSLLTSASTEWTTRALGCVLVMYSAFTLLARQFSVPPRMERWLSPVIGIITGAITGATGVFVIPAVPYLQALGLSKNDLIQALGLSFTASTIALTVGLGLGGAFDSSRLVTSALAVFPALLGMWSGVDACSSQSGDLSPVIPALATVAWARSRVAESEPQINIALRCVMESIIDAPQQDCSSRKCWSGLQFTRRSMPDCKLRLEPAPLPVFAPAQGPGVPRG